MKKLIYQIYYSEATKEANDKGFIPLDNLSNLRPDWQEYWPIRNYLLNLVDDKDCLLGFFSPKFFQKTGLNSSEVFSYINEYNDEFDVYTFSPAYDQVAYFRNVFEQGFINQPTIDKQTYIKVFSKIDPSVNIENLVMDSTTSVFCNYFVANVNFWKEWLANCEKVFELAEFQDSILSNSLNAIVHGSLDQKTTKPFVIERVASFMLATNPKWRIKKYDNSSIFSDGVLKNFPFELTELDLLKNLYLKTNDQRYLEFFYVKRTELLDIVNAIK